MAIVSYKLLSLLPLLASLAVLSRAMITPDGKTKTTSSLLDVQASIRKTLDVFSPGPREVEDSLTDDDHRPHSPPSSSKRSYSFTLRPRLSVRPTRARDYKSLMAARLERDSARMKSLRARLDPTVGTDADQDAPVTFSSKLGVGEYFVSLGIGDSLQKIDMAMDTGSDVIWVSKTVFDLSKLATYHELPCNDPLCQSCNNNKCPFDLEYLDGSTASGVLATEKVTFSGGSSVEGIVIGSADKTWGMLAGAGALVGLGRGALSLGSQMKASSFSYCLVDQDSKSESTLDFNSDAPGVSVFAPLISNQQTPNFYYVGLAGISVGGGVVHSVPPGGGDKVAIVDSGTAVTRLQSDLYTAVETEFVQLMSNNGTHPTGSVALFRTCYHFDSPDIKKAAVTTVSFHFSSDDQLDLPPENILVPVDSSGTYCFAFASDSTTVIGNMQQQGMRVSYDLDKNSIGFAPGQC